MIGTSLVYHAAEPDGVAMTLSSYLDCNRPRGGREDDDGNFPPRRVEGFGRRRHPPRWPGVSSRISRSVSDAGIRWDKAPCRFCGTGCSVPGRHQDSRVVATELTRRRSTATSTASRAISCPILYGPGPPDGAAPGKKNGKYDKESDFTPVSWVEEPST